MASLDTSSGGASDSSWVLKPEKERRFRIGRTRQKGSDGSRSNLPRYAPLLIVLVPVLFNAWTLRAELLRVEYLNDSAIHSSMVRWAAARIQEGHLPFDGWYPYLSLGSSRFHHYQSLPHILTGALTVLFGPRVFAWSLYLLLVLWPLAVYLGGRLLGWSVWASAAAAVISPLLRSVPGLGYEYGSYTWQGSGTWAQLWGMWALPICWGLTWRAISRGTGYALAAIALALTLALHLLTGYLALLSLGVWILVKPPEFLRRVGRGVLVGVGGLLAAAWMLVPLIADARWTAQDEFSRGTFYYDSFGARRVLAWLFTGGIFDANRLPVISLLVAVG
ncbi:MAG TPA: hypothetical protein VF984_12480, partial [Actinomycetota bacterium]